MIKIEIYTDGSCNQKAKTGGWSYIMLENGTSKIEKSGSEIDTTNNKCEMLAVINAFEELDKIEFFESTTISVYSDSAYVVNAFNDDWISGWLRNGWLNSYKKPVLNKELWERLIYFYNKYKFNFIQIPRMSNEYAKRVDKMARNPKD